MIYHRKFRDTFPCFIYCTLYFVGYKGNEVHNYVMIVNYQCSKYNEFHISCKLNRPHVIITLYVGVVEYYIYTDICTYLEK